MRITKRWTERCQLRPVLQLPTYICFGNSDSLVLCKVRTSHAVGSCHTHTIICDGTINVNPFVDKCFDNVMHPMSSSMVKSSGSILQKGIQDTYVLSLWYQIALRAIQCTLSSAARSAGVLVSTRAIIEFRSVSSAQMALSNSLELLVWSNKFWKKKIDTVQHNHSAYIKRLWNT